MDLFSFIWRWIWDPEIFKDIAWNPSLYETYAPGGLKFVAYVVCWPTLAVITILFWRMTFRAWRNPRWGEKMIENLRRSFGAGDTDLSRGHTRAAIPMGMINTGFLIGASPIGVYLIFPDPPWWYEAVAVDLAVTVVLWAGLWLSIAWFNRPKLLVMPYLRADPGFWEIRRVRRENERRDLGHDESVKEIDAVYERFADRWADRHKGKRLPAVRMVRDRPRRVGAPVRDDEYTKRARRLRDGAPAEGEGSIVEAEPPGEEKE
jgi:hypothetical protein